MSPRTLSRDEVRDVDRQAIEEYGLPGIVLMENAGRGCAAWLNELNISGRIVVCAGRGNNGGDGFVIARHLELMGHDVSVLLFSEPHQSTGDAAINFNVIQRAGTRLRVLPLGETATDEQRASFSRSLRSELNSADWIVDALLGTGTRGGLRQPFPQIIEAINQSPAKVFAVDLPSGLDCDTGLPVDADHPLAVEADCTGTFVALKTGFLNPAARRFTGEIRVIDIGVPRQLLQRLFDPHDA